MGRQEATERGAEPGRGVPAALYPDPDAAASRAFAKQPSCLVSGDLAGRLTERSRQEPKCLCRPAGEAGAHPAPRGQGQLPCPQGRARTSTPPASPSVDSFPTEAGKAASLSPHRFQVGNKDVNQLLIPVLGALDTRVPLGTSWLCLELNHRACWPTPLFHRFPTPFPLLPCSPRELSCSDSAVNEGKTRICLSRPSGRTQRGQRLEGGAAFFPVNEGFRASV